MVSSVKAATEIPSCENIVLWRGHFTPEDTHDLSMNLTINGGEGATSRLANRFGRLTHLPAYAASVWLNDVFLKTSYGKCVQLSVL